MTPMKTRTRVGALRGASIAALILIAAAGVATQERQRSAAAILAETRPALGAPGTSAALVEGDRIVWSGGDGLADVENEVPARGNTVYRIASISKPMAATAVMQLVERGFVKLDDPIRQYVPGFPPKGDQTVTIRHILTHTSGIRHYKPGEMENKETFDSVAGALAIFKDDPLLFTPGAKYSYSSYAYNLIAGVVEQASGLNYEAYLREKVWGPAGMTSTFLEHPQEMVPHRARQYVKAGPRVRNAPYADLSIKWAGGGVISTAEDLARFHIALDEGRLLKPETLARMYTPARLNDGSETGYGLGWFINKDAQGRRWVAHSGGATGGSTYLLRYPEGKLAVAILCNVENAGDLRTLAMRIAETAMAGAPSAQK